MKFKPGNLVRIIPTLQRVMDGYTVCSAAAAFSRGGNISFREMTVDSVAMVVRENNRLPGDYEILFDDLICIVQGEHIELL